MTKILEEIMKLSRVERLGIANVIMAMDAEEQQSDELTPEQEQMLLGRLESAKRNPEEGHTWDQVRARIKARK